MSASYAAGKVASRVRRPVVLIHICSTVSPALDVVDVQRHRVRPTQSRVDGLAAQLADPVVALGYPLSNRLECVASRAWW
jgi:hypothetical protein